MRIPSWILWTVILVLLQMAKETYGGHDYFGLAYPQTLKHRWSERPGGIREDPYNRGLWNRVPITSLKNNDEFSYYRDLY